MEKITEVKPALQNRMVTASEGHTSFDEWKAYKQLGCKMVEDTQLSLVVS